ncbi:MAG: hypothetical protein V4481_05705 [Patescibacteria group bacterium]
MTYMTQQINSTARDLALRAAFAVFTISPVSGAVAPEMARLRCVLSI